MLNLPSVQKNASRAAPNGNPDKAPRAAREELAGRIWPAGRRLPTSGVDECLCEMMFFLPRGGADYILHSAHSGCSVELRRHRALPVRGLSPFIREFVFFSFNTRLIFIFPTNPTLTIPLATIARLGNHRMDCSTPQSGQERHWCAIHQRRQGIHSFPFWSIWALRKVSSSSQAVH